MIQYRTMIEYHRTIEEPDSNPSEIIKQIDLKIRGLTSNEPNNPRINALIEYEIYSDKKVEAINRLLSDEDHSKLADFVRFNNQHYINSLLDKYTIGKLLPDEYATLQRVIELTDEALEELFVNQFSILDQEFQKFSYILKTKEKFTFITTNSETLSYIESGINAVQEYFKQRKIMKAKRTAGVFNTEDVILAKLLIIEKFHNLLELAWWILA